MPATGRDAVAGNLPSAHRSGPGAYPPLAAAGGRRREGRRRITETTRRERPSVVHPLILLPPSKGKASDPDATVPVRSIYAASLQRPHPLAAARREVLDAAVALADTRDDVALARWCGVAGSDAAAARTMLRGLAGAPTMPAHRRYTGIVHGNAGLATLDPAEVAAQVRIVSPLLGLVALDEPVPAYRLELAAVLPGVGGLAGHWREQLVELLCSIGVGRRVWDLLPAEHARIWARDVREELDVVTVRFLTPQGRSANAARTKVAKGRLAAHLIARPDLTPARLVQPRRGEGPLGPGWTLTLDPTDASTVVATFAG